MRTFDHHSKWSQFPGISEICNADSFLAECAAVLASLLHLETIQTNCQRVCMFLDNRAVCWALISESPCTLIQKCRLAFRRLWNYDFHVFWIRSAWTWRCIFWKELLAIAFMIFGSENGILRFLGTNASDHSWTSSIALHVGLDSKKFGYPAFVLTDSHSAGTSGIDFLISHILNAGSVASLLKQQNICFLTAPQLDHHNFVMTVDALFQGNAWCYEDAVCLWVWDES
jgi:hypothetical protein